MENNAHPEKVILKPSVIHDDLPEVRKPEHLRKITPDHDNAQPENPERNYHHDELRNVSSHHDETSHADDDMWDGEDA